MLCKAQEYINRLLTAEVTLSMLDIVVKLD